MNWGTRLTIVFICFAGMMITLVYKSYHTKFELVSKDYYGDELKYQEKIDGRANAAKRSTVSIEQEPSAIIIHLPNDSVASSISGEAWFYSNNDAVRDRRIRLNPASGNRQVILKKFLTTGNYELKLSWKENERVYYHETNLRIL